MKLFNLFQAIGIHILPVHYYNPIPDTRLLKSKDELFTKPSDLSGIDMNEAEQIQLLNQICPQYHKEYESIPLNSNGNPLEYYLNNGSFGFVSGQMHYCIIRHYYPKNIIEIGSGYSTLITLKAINQNKKDRNSNTSFTSIEPYPHDYLDKITDTSFTLIKHKAEEIPLRTFDQLGNNDILFIDSSHVSKFNSDVNYLMLEVLPRLNNGVIIHIHDIHFPFDYFKSYILKEHLFWNEQYLVQAFLMFNNLYKVLWCGSYMTWKYADLLSEHFPHFNPARIPTSLYIQKKH